VTPRGLPMRAARRRRLAPRRPHPVLEFYFARQRRFAADIDNANAGGRDERTPERCDATDQHDQRRA